MKNLNPPMVIKAISKVWFLTGGLYIMIGVWGFSMTPLFKQISAFKLGGNADSFVYDGIIMFVNNSLLISSIISIIGLAGIFEAFRFKSMKATSLYTLEGISWLTVLILICSLLVWVKVWTAVNSAMPPGLDVGSTIMQFVGLFAFVIADLATIAVMLAVIKKLKDPAIKALLKRKS